ncbi:MAG: hypothetical protein ACFNPY_02400, partial [Peptidiphaga sp.]
AEEAAFAAWVAQSPERQARYGDVRTAVEYGAAHGALAMTTPGDTSTASLEEVRRLVEGGGARVQR